MKYDPAILVTGFEPFFDLEKNPSWEAVKLLPDEAMDCRVIKAELPVVWFECSRRLRELIEAHKPRAVLMVGQGYPKPPVFIERIGMNICSGPDNTDEFDMYDEPIFYNAPAAYFSTFPYKAIHDRLKAEGIPAIYNFNAGQNQCNCVLYTALHYAATAYPGMLAGFIHVPMLPTERYEGMPLETTARAIALAVEETAKALRPRVRPLDEYRECL